MPIRLACDQTKTLLNQGFDNFELGSSVMLMLNLTDADLSDLPIWMSP